MIALKTDQLLLLHSLKESKNRVVRFTEHIRHIQKILTAVTRTSPSSGSSLHSSLSFPEAKLTQLPDLISSIRSFTGLWREVERTIGFRSLVTDYLDVC